MVNVMIPRQRMPPLPRRIRPHLGRADTAPRPGRPSSSDRAPIASKPVGNRKERSPKIEQEPSRRATCRLRAGTTLDALRIRRTPPLHTPSLGKRRRFDPRNEGGRVQEQVGRLRSSPADRRRLKPIPERSRKTDGKDRKTSPYLRDTRLRAQEGDLKGGF